MMYCEHCPCQGHPRYSPKQEGTLELLLVADHPKALDIRMGHFASREYRSVLSHILDFNDRVVPGQDFAVGCTPEGNKPDTHTIACCAPRIKSRISETKPKVVLLMGESAAKAFGFKQPIQKLRGNIYDLEVEGHPVKAVITYGAIKAYDGPGLSYMVKGDIQKALDIIRGRQNHSNLHLETPQSYEEIKQVISRAKQDIEASKMKRLVAVDTETTSLEPHRMEEKVIAVSLSWRKDQGMAFLLDHRESPLTDKQKQDILTDLEDLLHPDNVVTCAANAKFDYKWLNYRYGLNIPFFNFDILLAEHILDEDKKNNYKLKHLTRDYFPEHGDYDAEMEQALKEAQQEINQENTKHIDSLLEQYFHYWQRLTDEERKEILHTWMRYGYISLQEVDNLYQIRKVKQGRERLVSKNYKNRVLNIVKKLPSELSGLELPRARNATYEDPPEATLLKYAAMDAAMTRKIFTKQFAKMKEDTELITKLKVLEDTQPLFNAFETQTMPLCGKIAEMEYLGVRVDREKAWEYLRTMDEKIAEYKQQIFSEVGREFNLSSSAPDLNNILYNEKGFDVPNYTDSGKPSTDEEAINRLYEKYQSQFLELLLKHRKIEKARNTYVSNWLKLSEYDGRLHFSLHQNGTATFRLSSSNPNMQNLPSFLEEAGFNLKSLLIPDSEKYEFYHLDIANAEMRVLCAYSQDETLIEAFNNGMDIHSLTASYISDYSYEDIVANKENKSSEQHKWRKIAKQINFGTIYGMGKKRLSVQLDIGEADADEYLNMFMETYPGVKDYIDKTRSFAKRNKFVYTYTGRRRRFPLIGNDRFSQSQAQRQAINARIQTTSADIVNANIVDLDNAIKPLGGRVVLTVHDSILFQMPKGTTGVYELLDDVIIEGTKQRFPWLPVEWKYDVGQGPNYGECK